MAQANRTRASDAAVRVRRSPALGLALVQQWRSSGQTPAQFCRAHGIGVHRLHYWKRKWDGERTPAPSVTGEFLALSAPVRADAGERKRSDAEVRIEIERPERIVVRIPVDVGPGVFERALRAVLQGVAS